MAKVALYPYKNGSRSVRKLKELCQDLLEIRKRRSRFRKTKDWKVINWGSTSGPFQPDLNKHECVLSAVDKVATFQALKACGVNHPPFTTSLQEALGWARKGITLCVRHTATGHEGQGLEIILGAPDAIVPEAPLYTQYIKKKKEFRVHIFCGEVIDVQEKRKKKGQEGDHKVRNTANGYVFCRKDVVEPKDLREQAILACRAIGLDFGGVDVIWNEHHNKCYVLEINSAPGIEGTTAVKYVEAIKKWANP